jgi:hypothetical protein
MSAERRRWVIRAGTIKGQLETGGARRFRWRAAALRDGTSRVMGDCQARICEGLGVKFPGPTRRPLHPRAHARDKARTAPPPLGPFALSGRDIYAWREVICSDPKICLIVGWQSGWSDPTLCGAVTKDQQGQCNRKNRQCSHFVQECIFFNRLELALSEKQMPRFVGIVCS